jgi:hypothetical protein
MGISTTRMRTNAGNEADPEAAAAAEILFAMPGSDDSRADTTAAHHEAAETLGSLLWNGVHLSSAESPSLRWVLDNILEMNPHIVVDGLTIDNQTGSLRLTTREARHLSEAEGTSNSAAKSGTGSIVTSVSRSQNANASLDESHLENTSIARDRSETASSSRPWLEFAKAEELDLWSRNNSHICSDLRMSEISSPVVGSLGVLTQAVRHSIKGIGGMAWRKSLDTCDVRCMVDEVGDGEGSRGSVLITPLASLAGLGD